MILRLLRGNFFTAHLSRRSFYEMPKKYQDSFYLANSQLFDCVNWFIYNAYQIVSLDLMKEMMARRTMSSQEAHKAVSNAIKYLEYCNNLIDVYIPCKMDDGAFQVVRGFRAQHGLYYMRRPSLGGFRMCEDVEKDHVKALAAISTYRHACVGVNMAGAHGAIRICKDEFNSGELKRIVQQYVKEVCKRGSSGSHLDIYEPDMYCKPHEMAWFMEPLSEVGNRENKHTDVVGKPPDHGGIQDYDKAGGEGAYIVLNEFFNNKDLMKSINIEPGWKNKTFICQGLGNMGSVLGTCLEQAGAKCIGFKEIDCCGYDSEGYSLEEMLKFKATHGSMLGYKEIAQDCEGDAVLTKECDVLILGATHKTMHCYLADHVHAKIILEASLAAVTPTAQKILMGKNKLVIPDILATAGISVASYCEYSKTFKDEMLLGRNFKDMMKMVRSGNGSVNKSNAVMPKMVGSSEYNMVYSTMQYVLEDTVKDVFKYVDKYKLGLDIRTAAYIHSINKIFDSIIDCKKY